jgi:hypothetical protein
MSSLVSVFVAEGNVEVYLSKLLSTFNQEEREALLRLLADEQTRMGPSPEHVENGQRRVVEGRQRIEKQREVVGNLTGQPPSERQALLEQAVFMLETLERTQSLLEQHLKRLECSFPVATARGMHE